MDKKLIICFLVIMNVSLCRFLILLYMHQRTIRKLQNICGKYGKQTYFKGNTIIKQTLIRPKDQDPKDSRSGVIYSYKCEDITCGEEYIGETARSLGGEVKGTP